MRYIGRHRRPGNRRTMCQLSAAAALLAVLGPSGASGPAPAPDSHTAPHSAPAPTTRPTTAHLGPIRPETAP